MNAPPPLKKPNNKHLLSQEAAYSIFALCLDPAAGANAPLNIPSVLNK